MSLPRSILNVVLLCCVIIFPLSTVLAQEAPRQELPTPALAHSNPTASDPGKTAGPVSLMGNREFWLSCIILVFGVFIIAIEYFLLRGVVQNKTEEIARTYTVTLIIIGTLVLISSGFTNEQIAPALGLFGTIAGYLLGRSDVKQRLSTKPGGDDNES